MPTSVKSKVETKKNYDFGEKKEENINGHKVPVEFHTPKYKEAKNKAIELLNSDKYKDTLEPSDFWILVNTYANKTKAMYSGLIISHDGCLKINDVLDEQLKFKPECMSIDKEGYNNSLVFSYMCPEQGLYEVGEVSKDNCKNDYPYAMALKRCFDRVVLKNSKIAYSGIYSDSESDEFLKRTEETEEVKPEEKPATKTTTKKTADKVIMIQGDQIDIIKSLFTPQELVPFMKHLGKKKLEELTLIEASSLIKRKQQEKKTEEIPQEEDNYLE